MTTTTTPKRGDRIRNVHGFAGTVERVYPDEGLARINYDDEVRGRIIGRVWHSRIAELEVIPGPRTIVVTADEVAPGMTLNYPVDRDRRPAGALGNVNPEPLRVKAIDDRYPGNRVMWFDPFGSSAVVGRTARLELVVPDDDEARTLVDVLAELEAAIAEGGPAGEELERAAAKVAKVRGRIIARATR